MILKARKGVIITKRDEKLFRYLFVNKVATNSHLQADVFEHASKQAVHRRLDKLITAGFIEAIYLRGNGNRLVYSLSKKALLKFIGGREELKRLQRKSSSVLHDLGLLEIKRRLSKCNYVENYLSENVLVSGIFDDESDIREIRKVHPDAILKVSMPDRHFNFPLEYEASAKFAGRYDKLMAKYYLMDEVKAVLFISKSITIQKKVMQAEKKRCKNTSGKFFYCLYENVIELGEKAQFINNQKEVLIMN
ncbi:hypothetical protein OAT67_02275 [Bacteriovoracaceae bacterium]|nr:hypothetical protein [Bacteriovoracaceae bacterium]